VRLALVLGLFVLVTPFSVGGAERAILLGEVRANASSGAFVPELRRVLDLALGRTLARAPRERYVLSATLVRLDAERSERSGRATAAVSLVLRREKGQILHAILSGRATAEESGADLDGARGTALHAAVESALRRLPEAVAR
jgi:hypothetical protein